MQENIRDTKEIVLQDSGAKVTLYSQLTNGDFRKIQRFLVSAVTVSVDKNNPTDPNVSGVSATVGIDKQDLVLKLLIKDIYDRDGNKVSDIDGFLYGISVADGQTLYFESEIIADNSSLGGESKKK